MRQWLAVWYNGNNTLVTHFTSPRDDDPKDSRSVSIRMVETLLNDGKYDVDLVAIIGPLPRGVAIPGVEIFPDRILYSLHGLRGVPYQTLELPE